MDAGRERRFEIVATVILALTALATAWSGYQASLWDGIQSSDYSKASGLRTEAAQLATEANQYRLADLSMFQGYLAAESSGDEELAAFYRGRFRPEFAVAFEAWLALDPHHNLQAPIGPFAMPEYQLAVEKRAETLSAQATIVAAEGDDANGYSDVFTLATLLFAASLFFAGISERFEYVPARSTLLGLAGLGLVVGVAIGFTQPLTWG